MTTTRERVAAAASPRVGIAASSHPGQAGGAASSPAAARPAVNGLLVDAETRCTHWRGPLDIIAIRFSCCGKFHACYDCHSELESHAPVRWPRELFDTPAVLCGACGHMLLIREYLDCGYRCPACARGFNPRCGLHHHLYFQS